MTVWKLRESAPSSSIDVGMGGEKEGVEVAQAVTTDSDGKVLGSWTVGKDGGKGEGEVVRYVLDLSIVLLWRR